GVARRRGQAQPLWDRRLRADRAGPRRQREQDRLRPAWRARPARAAPVPDHRGRRLPAGGAAAADLAGRHRADRVAAPAYGSRRHGRPRAAAQRGLIPRELIPGGILPPRVGRGSLDRRSAVIHLPATSRRRLIGGLSGAVLVVGASGAALAAKQPKETKPPPQPEKEKKVGAVEDLMREHGVLRRALLIYRQSAAKLRAGTAIDPKPLRKTAQLFRDFGENYHER